MDTIMKCIWNVLYYRSIKSNFRILLIMLFMLKLSYEYTTYRINELRGIATYERMWIGVSDYILKK